MASGTTKDLTDNEKTAMINFAILSSIEQTAFLWPLYVYVVGKELSTSTDPWSNMGAGLVPNIDIDTPYCRVNRIYNT